MRVMSGLVATVCALLCAVAHGADSRVIELDETVISGNQELPKVLYILPWRQPEGLPEIEVQTEFGELTVFKRLYPPAYRRELDYFRNLETNLTEVTED